MTALAARPLPRAVPSVRDQPRSRRYREPGQRDSDHDEADGGLDAAPCERPADEPASKRAEAVARMEATS